MRWLGIDIGGANLKAADGHGRACSVPFALWRDPHGLASALGPLINAAPNADRLAVTMTGELCDAFRTKAEGVRHILAAVQQAANGRHVAVYLVDGRLVGIEEAAESPHLAAASNWHALARFACRFVDGNAALVIDTGSTTTDIVPLVDNQPQPRGLNDTARLLAGELVYTGVGRTPICAIAQWLPWRGTRCPVAAELFATAADAYVVLGELPEQPDMASTADGRPLTEEFARERLARMICADAAMFDHADAERAAAAVRDSQLEMLQQAIGQVIAMMTVQPRFVIVGGIGEFLARTAVRGLLRELPVISLAERLGQSVSQCAPAHALAVLAGQGDEPSRL